MRMKREQRTKIKSTATSLNKNGNGKAVLRAVAICVIKTKLLAHKLRRKRRKCFKTLVLFHLQWKYSEKLDPNTYKTTFYYNSVSNNF